MPVTGLGTKEIASGKRLRVIHLALRVTPAMEAGVVDHVWSLDQIISLLN